MVRISLPPLQIQKLKHLAAHPTADAVARRASAVLMLAEGTPVWLIAQRVGVTPRAVYYWIEHLDQLTSAVTVDLAQELSDRPRSGRPRIREPLARLIAEVMRYTPRVFGYEGKGDTWSNPLLQQCLRERADVNVSETSIRRARQVLRPTEDPALHPPEPAPPADMTMTMPQWILYEAYLEQLTGGRLKKIVVPYGPGHYLVWVYQENPGDDYPTLQYFLRDPEDIEEAIASCKNVISQILTMNYVPSLFCKYCTRENTHEQ